MCAKRAEAANYARRVANGRKPVNSVMGRKFAKAVKKYTVAAVVFLKLLECFCKGQSISFQKIISASCMFGVY